MKKQVYAVAAAILLGGCAQVQPAKKQRTVTIDVPFDVAKAKSMMAVGVNYIKGNAFMRQRGGGVITCAGMDVHLTPATDYATKRMVALYGNSLNGFSSDTNPPSFSPTPTEYLELSKETKCDAQGNFAFDRVADGEFYITTSVAWIVGNRLQGGAMVTKVRVENGSSASVILAH